MKSNFSTFSGKKVLVTGATGFIGPHLCQKLASIGARVIAVSRKPVKNLFQKTNNIQHYQVDFTNLDEVRVLFRKVEPEFIFHLAGLAAGSREVELIEPTFQSNLMTTINALIAVNEQKTSRLIVIGSMEEPAEDDIDFIPSSPYAASKWAASNYARMFHSLYGTNLVIARLFMTYGPGNQPEKKLLPYVINNLLEGNAPKLSSGSRQIDWIYIDDVVEGLLSIAITPGIEGETIDIGSGSLITTRDFVRVIQKVSDTKTELHFGEQHERTNEQTKKANIESTFNKTGWKPVISLQEGLRKTVDWFKQQKELTVY